MKACNGVFEGGGVRGIGHVGAACRMEEAGYQFMNLAGSSAGAIVAALLAAGYTCEELKKEMESLDYMKFRGKELVDYFGTLGKALSILFTFGIYDTDYLEEWISGLLEKKGVFSFGDIENLGKTLKITASDLTSRKLLLLPDDLKRFGLEPETFSVAYAVRMSVSIPVYFEPVRLREKGGRVHMVVDGGLLSNYPIWMFDSGAEAGCRTTFGFKFFDMEKEISGACAARGNIVDYLKSIVSTCLGAVDRSHISEGDRKRTILIPTRVKDGDQYQYISATDFEIGSRESRELFENGRRAAEAFLKTWQEEACQVAEGGRDA